MNPKVNLTAAAFATTTLMLAGSTAKAQDNTMPAPPAAIASVPAPQDGATLSPTVRLSAADIEKGYSIPRRDPIQTPDPRLLQGQLADYERHLNALGYSLANPDDAWDAAPILNLSEIEMQNRANAAPAFASVPGIALGGGTVYDTISKSWIVGNQSSLWADLYFGVTHSGSRSLARVQGQARLDGAILGYTKNLALATADLQAPAIGNQSISLNLSALGYTLWSKNQTGATVNINDGKDWTGTFWQAGFDWSIAGYGVGASLWLQGTVGAHYTASCKPLYANMGADADAAVSVGGRAWANVGIVDASLEAQLTLASLDINTSASTAVTANRPVFRQSVSPESGRGSESVPAGAFTDGSGRSNLFGGGGLYGYTMTAKRVTQVDLHLLKGYAKVRVTDPIFGWTLGTWTIWNSTNGLYNWTGTLENYSKSYSL
jgi:hypothetical protein